MGYGDLSYTEVITSHKAKQIRNLTKKNLLDHIPAHSVLVHGGSYYKQKSIISGSIQV